MTRRSGKTKNWRRRNGKRNIEIERRLRWYVIIMRSVNSLRGLSPLFVNGSCKHAISRNYW